MKLTPAPSPKGTNREGLFLHRGRLLKRGHGLALDESPEKDMLTREYESDDENPLSRLRVWLRNAGLSSAPDLSEIVDALERERGGGAGTQGARDDDGEEDDTDSELRRMLKEVPGLTASDAEKICRTVADSVKRATKDSAMPTSGIKGPRRPSPAMDSRTISDIDRLVPGFSAIGVESFGQRGSRRR